MSRLIALLLLMLATQGAAAKIYRCVDPATGQATFTDVACAENRSSSDQVRAAQGNFGDRGGFQEPTDKYRKTWRSQDPDREGAPDAATPRADRQRDSAARSAD
jgi:hypothetical protein